jgi:hypothetical protein
MPFAFAGGIGAGLRPAQSTTASKAKLAIIETWRRMVVASGVRPRWCTYIWRKVRGLGETARILVRRQFIMKLSGIHTQCEPDALRNGRLRAQQDAIRALMFLETASDCPNPSAGADIHRQTHFISRLRTMIGGLGTRHRDGWKLDVTETCCTFQVSLTGWIVAFKANHLNIRFADQ